MIVLQQDHLTVDLVRIFERIRLLPGRYREIFEHWTVITETSVRWYVSHVDLPIEKSLSTWIDRDS